MGPSKYLQVTPSLVVGFLIALVLSIIAWNVNMVVGELINIRTTVIKLNVNMEAVIDRIQDHEQRLRNLGG